MRCLLVISKHDLGPKDTEIWRLLATCVAQVYLPMFLHYIKNKKVKNASNPYLKTESWWAHPENVLVALLCSNDKIYRHFAVDTIMAIRAGSEEGSKSMWSFKFQKR